MRTDRKALITSIYDKHLEVHYDEKRIKLKGGKDVKIQLQGKIKCPLLNSNISSIVCSKIMDNEGWPRKINPNICKECECYVYLSIQKFQERKKTWNKPNMSSQ